LKNNFFLVLFFSFSSRFVFTNKTMATLTIVPFIILSPSNKSSRQNKHLNIKKREPGAFFYSWRNKLWPIKDILQASHNIFFYKYLNYYSIMSICRKHIIEPYTPKNKNNKIDLTSSTLVIVYPKMSNRKIFEFVNEKICYKSIILKSINHIFYSITTFL
jgi:hypothetical protein